MKMAFAVVFAVCALVVSSQGAAATFTHSVPAYFVPGKRVSLNANIADPKGVQLARVYFKSDAQADFLFVPMRAFSVGRYSAALPAPNPSTNAIEYLILALDNDGQVTRTRTYKMLARRTSETPAWQAGGNGELKVYTELPNAPRTVAGFTDSISLDLVESGARFGTAAGLYPAVAGGGSSAGSTTASTSTSTPATTTAAATGGTGMAAMAIVGGVALAAAAAVGIAAAASSTGGSSGGPLTYACSLRICSRESTTGQCFCSGGSVNDTCSVGIPQWQGVSCNGTAGPQTTSCPTGSHCRINVTNGFITGNSFCTSSGC